MSGDWLAGPAVDGMVRRMAEREAASLLQHPLRAAYVDHPPMRVWVCVAACPWCGRQAVAQPPYEWLAPTRQVWVRPAAAAAAGGTLPTGDHRGRATLTAAAVAGQVTLTALACESLTGRSLLLLVKGAEQGGLPSRAFVTRAAAVAQMAHNGHWPELPELLARLDAAESWLDDLLGTAAARPGSPLPHTLPAATRRSPEPGMSPAARLAPHFLTPHLPGLGELNRAYLRWRAATVATGLA